MHNRGKHGNLPPQQHRHQKKVIRHEYLLVLNTMLLLTWNSREELTNTGEKAKNMYHTPQGKKPKSTEESNTEKQGRVA